MFEYARETSDVVLLDCGANVCVFPRSECVQVWKEAVRLFLGDDKPMETGECGRHPVWGDGVVMADRKGVIVAFSRAWELFHITFDSERNAFVLSDKKDGNPVFIAECQDGLYPLKACKTVSSIFRVGAVSNPGSEGKLLQAAVELHNRLGHVSYERIAKYIRCYEGFEKLEISKLLESHQCVPCQEAKTGPFKNQFPRRERTHNPKLGEQPVRGVPKGVTLGQRISVDILFAKGNVYLLGAEFTTNLLLLYRLPNKKKDSVLAAIQSFVGRLKSFGDHFNRLIECYADHETVFTSLKDDLLRLGIELRQSAPYEHQVLIETLVSPLRRSMKAIERQIYTTHELKLPEILHPWLLEYCVNISNAVGNTKTEGWGKPPYLIATQRETMPVPISFGTIACFRDPSQPINLIGMVVGVSLESSSVLVYFPQKKEPFAWRRRGVVLKPESVPSWFKSYFEKGVDINLNEFHLLTPQESASEDDFEAPLVTEALPKEDEQMPLSFGTPSMTQALENPTSVLSAEPGSEEMSMEEFPQAEEMTIESEIAVPEEHVAAPVDPNLRRSTRTRTTTAQPDYHYYQVERHLMSLIKTVMVARTVNPNALDGKDLTIEEWTELAKQDSPRGAEAGKIVELFNVLSYDTFLPQSPGTIPPGTNIIPCSMIDARKTTASGDFITYKGRLVAGGHRDKHDDQLGLLLWNSKT